MSVCNILNASGANKGKIGSQFLPDLTPVQYGFYKASGYVDVTSDPVGELNVTSTDASGIYTNYNSNVGTAVSDIKFLAVPAPLNSKFKVNFTVKFTGLQINTEYLDATIGTGQILVTRVPIKIWGSVEGLTFQQYTQANPYLTFIELVNPTFPPGVTDTIVFQNVNQQIQFTDYCDGEAGNTDFFGVKFSFALPFGINNLTNYNLSAIETITTENLLGTPSTQMNMAVSLTVMNI